MAAKYGQHFLINRHAVERIVSSVNITPNDVVLEIGPGKGALTQHLLAAKTVAVIEIDLEMVQKLESRFGFAKNVVVFNEDILKFSFDKLNPYLSPDQDVKILGNLPYNLTSPILRRLSNWTGWRNALVMVQKEVGDRLCAKVGSPDYGALTVGMSLTCEAEFVFELAATSFDPPPKVKSAVVRLRRREKPLTDKVEAAQKVIQAAFQQRRKTILNSFSHGLNLEKAKVSEILKTLNIDEGLRAERLSVSDFIRVMEALEI